MKESTAPLSVVDLGGSPRQIGLEHGRRLRDEIRSCIDIYRMVLQRSDDVLLRAAIDIERTVRRFSPAIATEIDAIAEGAGIDRAWVYVLNGRSELMAGVRDGCTAVFVPEHALLGQTWDWLEALEPLIAVLRVELEDGRALLTVTEPGMVAKIGCNSSGVGVCLNFMYAAGPLLGLPVHVLLRALLEAPDLEAARLIVEGVGGGRAANVMVGSSSGSGIDVEYLGDEVRTHQLGATAYTHTNHVGGRPDTGGPLLENSAARLAAADDAAERIDSTDSLFALLGDQRDPLHPICAPYEPYLGVNVGTVATVVMQLDRSRLHVRLGPKRDIAPAYDLGC